LKQIEQDERYAECGSCGREMSAILGGCGVAYAGIGGKAWARIHFGAEDYPSEVYERPCHDCNALPGQLHHVACDMERCPKCQGQMLTCACDVDEWWPQP
jgi:hypothetical protein